jgi:eukaryotic-like serine/threonine-protein kinase
MGEVYLAHHALLKRPTAIKLLPPERLGERAIARFEREVRELSRLCHPNTVAIYDFGRTPEGIFYYAMEYLEGLDLEELMELDGPQPPGRVIHVLAQVAHALAEAHREGLIHRDVKPANVVLCERGGVADLAKVIDFGLVKDIQTGSPALSTGDVLTGTPLFMAPEAITHPDEVDGRTDLYALGAVGYYLLTGQHVFDGATLVEVCSKHLHTRPMPPSQHREVPTDLEAVILRCLEKRPDDRHSDASVLRRALLACRAADSWGDVEAEQWWVQNRGRVSELRARGRRHSASPTELGIELMRRAPAVNAAAI